MLMQLAAAVAIVGSWAPQGSHCHGGDGYVFEADGTFGNENRFGHWRQQGDRLHVEIDGKWSTVRLRREDRRTVAMTWPDGYSVRWRRCTGSGEPWFDGSAKR